jgi:3-dehydrosphinganine reductase
MANDVLDMTWGLSIARRPVQFRHALITGGSSGIGLATALRLVERGSDVTILARGQERLSAAEQVLLARRTHPAQRVFTVAADVRDQPAVEQAIGAAIDNLGCPDLVMTCAGMCYPGRIRDLTPKIFVETNAVNYLGTIHSVLGCLPAMRRQRAGRLLLVSSGAGLIGITGYAAYSPTKFALRGLAEALRADLKPDGIEVSIVYPPDTETPQLALERTLRPPETERIAATVRAWSAERVADAVLRGLDRGHFAITPGLEMTLLEPLSGLLRPLLAWHFDRLAARTRRDAVS